MSDKKSSSLFLFFFYSLFTCQSEFAYSQKSTIDKELELYMSHMDAASALLQLNETKAAKANLEKAPEKYRGWEWSFLYNQLDQSIKTFTGHENNVVGIAISPDGKIVASGSADTTIIFWDFASGKILNKLKGHSSQITALAFTPDGKQLVSGSTDKTIKVWDVNTGNELRTISEGLSQGIYDVEISPDGKWIATGSWQLTNTSPPVEGFAKIFDLQTGKEIKKYFMTPHPCSSIKFTSDGKKLVIGGWGFHIKIYDLATDKMELDIDIDEEAHYTAIQSLALNPDDSKIIVGCKDKQIRMYDLKTGKLIYKIDPYKGHKKIVNAVSFIGNGNWFVSGSQDNMIKVWETNTGDLKYELRGHLADVQNLACSNDGKYFVSASKDCSVKIWDVEVLKRSQLRACDDVGPWSMPYNEKNNILASSCGAEGIRIFEMENGKEIGRIGGETFYFMDIDETGQYMATGYETNSLTIWNFPARAKIKTVEGHKDIIRDIKFIQKKNYLVTGGADNKVRIWTYPDLMEIKAFDIGDETNTIAVSRDGTLIAAGTTKSGVIVWETKTWNQVAQLKTKGGISRINFSQDGSLLVSGSNAGEVKLWEMKTFQLMQDFKGHVDRTSAVAIDPDNKRVVSGADDYTLRFWDAATGANVLTLRGNPEHFFHIEFSKDGSTLIVGETQGLIRFLKTGK